MTVAEHGGVADVDLILLTQDGERFILYADGARLNCPRLVLRQADQARDNLAALVEHLAVEQFGYSMSYLGVIACDTVRPICNLVIAASVRGPWEAVRPDPRLRTLTLAEVKSRGHDVQHGEHFRAVRRWHKTNTYTSSLGDAFRQAMDSSISYLQSHLSIEDGHWGWNQYLDSGPVGMISTAEGILAHVHAGVNGEFVDKPAITLEAMQNSDGGWKVRRALVGAYSDDSITESTCSCLWALYEMGRSVAEPAVRNGIAWLEALQRPDGGWSSSATDDESLVFPTTAAVRVLARFKRTEAVAKGVAWLRSAQCPDGGWGAMPPTPERKVSSSPAYAGYAVVALIVGGLPVDDKVIIGGREYLYATFDPNRTEPWESIAFTQLVNPRTAARMDFRHFATPWALAALCLSGRDISDALVLEAIRGLLRLQQSSGAWRSALTAPGDTPVWAIHDALYALRVVLTTSARNLGPIALDQYLKTERTAMQRFAVQLIDQNTAARSPRVAWRNWLQTTWMSALTVCVIVLILAQVGLLKQLQSSSGVRKAWAAIAAGVVTSIGAVSPPIIAEEYKIRRSRAATRAKSSAEN